VWLGGREKDIASYSPLIIARRYSQFVQMRNFITLSILILLASCSKRLTSRIYIADENKYEITKGNFTGNSELKEETFSNGQIKERGNYAYDDENVLSTLKVGEWSSFYENGQLKSTGKYNIGTYIQCCFSGACKQFYNYKNGTWKYYHPNGQLRATGEYEIKQLHVDTSCEGGDEMPFGLTSTQWQYFNEQGESILPTEEMILELETVKTGGNTMAYYFFPNPNKESIEMEFEK
jgi:hypothetical protein